MKEVCLTMVKYRDPGLPTYTYFWIESKNHTVVSPYFDTEDEAKNWLATALKTPKDK